MKIEGTNKWLISNNEEYWDYCYDEFDSKQQAIEEGKKIFLKEPFYVGEMFLIYFTKKGLYQSDFSEQIISLLSDELYQTCGESFESWLESLTKEKEEKLNYKLANCIFEWIKEENMQPNCFLVKNIEEIENF